MYPVLFTCIVYCLYVAHCVPGAAIEFGHPCTIMSFELENVKAYKGTKVVHINIRSLVPHFEEIESILADGVLDLLIISESWLHSRVSDSLVSVNNYQLFRLDRRVQLPNGSIKRGGGVCIYAKNDHSVTTWPHLEKSNSDLELLSVTCKKGNNRKINLHAVYRPPTGNVQSAINQIRENIIEIKQCSSGDNIIIGDMNIDSLSQDRHARLVHHFAGACNLKQVVSEPTRFTGKGCSLLDHIYTDMDHLLYSGTINSNISDHLPVFVVRKKQRNHTKFREIEGRSYKHFSENEFIAEFTSSLEFCDMFCSDDPQLVWEIILAKIMAATNKHCPMKRLCVPSNKCEYLTDRVIRLMKDRDSAFKALRRNPSSTNWANARRLRRLVAKEIKLSKRAYVMKHLTRAKGDSSKFWRFLNNSFFKIRGSEITQITVNNQVLEGKPAANAVNNYFCNISRVLSDKFTGSNSYDTHTVCEVSCTEVPQLSVRRVSEAINRIDQSKSSGIPGLPAKLLKTALKAIPEIFTSLLNLCLTKVAFP